MVTRYVPLIPVRAAPNTVTEALAEVKELHAASTPVPVRPASSHVSHVRPVDEEPCSRELPRVTPASILVSTNNFDLREKGSLDIMVSYSTVLLLCLFDY